MRGASLFLDFDGTLVEIADRPDAVEVDTRLAAIVSEDPVSVEQSYLRNTPILVSRHTDAAGGAMEVVDFCPYFSRLGRKYRPVAFARIVAGLLIGNHGIAYAMSDTTRDYVIKF